MSVSFKYLRPIEYRDIPYMLEWMRDDEINRNFRFDAEAITEESEKIFIEHAKEAFLDYKNAEKIDLAAVDENDEYMGTITLQGINRADNNALYAIAMRKCAHGTGLALAASRELIMFGFDELRLHKIYLNVLKENVRAARFYEKLGFKLEGESPEQVYARGEYHTWLWYGLFREDVRQCP